MSGCADPPRPAPPRRPPGCCSLPPSRRCVAAAPGPLCARARHASAAARALAAPIAVLSARARQCKHACAGCALSLQASPLLHTSTPLPSPRRPRRRSPDVRAVVSMLSAATVRPTAHVLAARAPLTVPAGRARGHLYGACTVAVATTHHSIIANTFPGDNRTPWRPQIRA